MVGYERPMQSSPAIETAIVLILGDPALDIPLVRLQSQCYTGEMLGSLRCDCGGQLSLAMNRIAAKGCGLLIYALQDCRLETVAAYASSFAISPMPRPSRCSYLHRIREPDSTRDFSLSAAILNDIGVSRVRLVSNNPDKVPALLNAGIQVEGAYSL
jgi:GTP cyclohydrolase II